MCKLFSLSDLVVRHKNTSAQCTKSTANTAHSSTHTAPSIQLQPHTCTMYTPAQYTFTSTPAYLHHCPSAHLNCRLHRMRSQTHCQSEPSTRPIRSVQYRKLSAACNACIFITLNTTLAKKKTFLVIVPFFLLPNQYPITISTTTSPYHIRQYLLQKRNCLSSEYSNSVPRNIHF